MVVDTRVAARADVERMVRLHLASFSTDDHLGVLLGQAFIRASYRWHVRDESACAIVAEAGGRLVGLCGVCDGPFTGRMIHGCAAALVAGLVRRPGLLANRRLWSRLTRTTGHPEWVSRFCASRRVAQLTYIAVDANSRGNGVFPSLVRRCEAICRSREITAIRVGVYRSNLRSQRAFEKCGWRLVPALGSDEMVCLVRVLNAATFEAFPDLGGAVRGADVELSPQAVPEPGTDPERP